jgi:hypothetical protein
VSPTPASTPSPRSARCRICRLDLMDDRRCPRCGVRDRRTDPINPAWRAQSGLTKEGRVDPVTIQVHCEQHLHPIRFDGHQLHFPAHELGSLQFLAALQTDNRCAEIWREVHRRRTLGTSPRSWSYRIPPPLRRVLMLRLSLKRQTHHGEHLTPAAAGTSRAPRSTPRRSAGRTDCTYARCEPRGFRSTSHRSRRHPTAAPPA